LGSWALGSWALGSWALGSWALGSWALGSWALGGLALGGRGQAVLEDQVTVVAVVEQLDLDVRVQLAQAAQLAVLLRDQALFERRQLDVEIQFRQVEVGRESLHHPAVVGVAQRKAMWLVLPGQLIEVEDAREIFLAGVRKRGPAILPRAVPLAWNARRRGG